MSDLPRAISEVGLPAVIKPLRSWVEQGELRQRLVSQIAVDPLEARTAAQEALTGGVSVLVQEWLPGAREAVWLLYADGRFWARFAQIAHRMFPILGGASILRESIALVPELVEPAEALVAGAGLSGFSEVEFRRDRAGQPRLMEINPRFSASLQLADRAGVDFPKLVFSWAAGEPLKPVSRYRVGVRMRWLSGDLLWLRATLRSQGRPDTVPAGRAVRTFIADSLRPTGYDYLGAGDPRPAAIAARDFIGLTLRTTFRRKGSRQAGSTGAGPSAAI
jgi:predicted ATP-grasp superfamily ATP-dependent carboligase